MRQSRISRSIPVSSFPRAEFGWPTSIPISHLSDGPLVGIERREWPLVPLLGTDVTSDSISAPNPPELDDETTTKRLPIGPGPIEITCRALGVVTPHLSWYR